MFENYEGGKFEGGSVGEKTEQLYTLLQNTIGFEESTKIINGNPVVGKIEFRIPEPPTSQEDWMEYRSAVLQVCQESSTEEIDVQATADNNTNTFFITIKEIA